MILVQSRTSSPATAFPRMSGDDPFNQEVKPYEIYFSPHERG